MYEFEEFVPTNSLEESLIAAREGRLPLRQFLSALLSSDVALPSRTEIKGDGSDFDPIIFSKDGQPMLAIFTSLERAALFRSEAPFALVTNAKEIFRRLPKEYGIVVNPRSSQGFDMSPRGLQDLLKEEKTEHRGLV